MRKASVAKISLLIFMTEPSIWRLRNGVGKIYKQLQPFHRTIPPNITPNLSPNHSAFSYLY